MMAHKDNNELSQYGVDEFIEKQGEKRPRVFKTYLTKHASEVTNWQKTFVTNTTCNPIFTLADTSNGPKSILPSNLASEVDTANPND